MNKRIIKIWSLVLTIMLVASMLVFAVPTSAALGDTAWASQPLPSATGSVLLNGSDVGGIAVAGDGTTIYAIDSADATGAVFKSTNAGQTFTRTTTNPAAVALTYVAVAPDNPEVIAVTDSSGTVAGTNVWISTNSGTTWSAMGFPLAGARVTGLAAGPARSGALLGREFAVSLADPAAATIALGDVRIIGGTAAWASVAAVGGTRDYTAVAFTPNFVGDRCLVVVGTAGAASTAVQILNTQTNAIVRTTVLNGAGTTTDLGAAATSITSADVALPSDFDATTGGGRRTYVGITSAVPQADNDVYRVDDNSATKLGAVTTLGVFTVAYAGTIDTGTLFMAEQATANVRYTTNAQVSSPTWVTTKKLLLAATTNNFIRVAADFGTTNRVFVGTTGAESAFSVSNNGGISFDQESMIDTGFANLVALQGVALTPDGKTIFVAADDGTQLSLWKSATPVSSSSWSRIYVAAGTTGFLALNPGWTTSPTIYLADLVANGNVFRSSDGGSVFATRVGPAVVPVYYAVQDANIIYSASGTVVYKSTNGSWTWGSPVGAKAGAIISMVVGKADYLLVGGTGNCSYSSDGAASFTQIVANAGETYAIAASETFATNNTFFAGDTTAAAPAIYRFVIGTDTVLVNIGGAGVGFAPATAIRQVAQMNKVLYVLSGLQADRALDPTLTPGMVRWSTMNTPALTAAINLAVAKTPTNVAYATDLVAAVPTLWGYSDPLATEKTVNTNPGDGASVAIDPVNGRADPVTLMWQPLGTGTGTVNSWQVQIKIKADSWSSATTSGNIVPAVIAQPQVIMGPVGAFAFTMNANTEYEWRIRANNQTSGDAILSNWSAPFTLKVQSGGAVQQPYAGPMLQGPQLGATGVSLSPGFSWAPVTGASQYKFVLATDAALTKTLAGTPATLTSTTFQVTTPLEYGTVYFWSVQATAPTVSPVATATFTTMAKPAPTAPPVTQPPVVIPTITVPPPIIPPAQQIAPAYIWAIIAIGAVLVIAVIVLIARTRRPM